MCVPLGLVGLSVITGVTIATCWCLAICYYPAGQKEFQSYETVVFRDGLIYRPDGQSRDFCCPASVQRLAHRDD